MQVQLAIDWSQSLKDKRRVVRSLKDTLHRHHQVSVAEVDDQDILNRASLGISLAGTDGAHVGSVLDRVLDRIRTTPDCEVSGTSREILRGWVGSYASNNDGGGDGDGGADTLAEELLSRGREAIEGHGREKNA
ncbi:MAG: DUF503 domain-containing protein [Phycisphaerales bacterium]